MKRVGLPVFLRNLVLGFLCLVFVFGLDKVGLLKGIREWGERAWVIPLKQIVYDWERKFMRKEDGCVLEHERKIEELEGEILALKNENLAQKKMLSVVLPAEWQFLGARVLEVGGETLIIDKGKREGVKEGMVVLLEKNYLGKVGEVSESLSRVRLVTFLDERLVVRIFSPKNGGFVGRGLLKGRGLGEMRVEQVLFQEPVEVDDLVMVSVEGRDLLVGEVEEVLLSEEGVFKMAKVKRLWEPEKLLNVFIKL